MLNISDFPWAECNMVENRNLYVSDNLALKRNKRDTGVMRYEFELVTIEMDFQQGREIKAKLSRATTDSMSFVHPRWSYSSGTIPGVPITVAGNQAAGVDTISVYSAGIYQLKAGDFLQPSNDTKVYEVAEDTNLLNGTQSVKLTSILRNPLVAGNQMTVDGVAFFLESDGIIEVATAATDGSDIQLTLNAVEKL